MREQYMRCGEGFVLCYSVTDRRSFRAAAEYRRLLSQARPSERLPLVLVGNKLDLAPRCRQVSCICTSIPQRFYPPNEYMLVWYYFREVAYL